MALIPAAAGSADPAIQLTTLPGWRQFVAAVPSIPHLLTEQEWLLLEDGKRAAHDEERLEKIFGAEYTAYRGHVKRWIPGVL